MIQKCHAVGCGNTMHPTCVQDFEDGINYDEYDGKVDGTYYCPLHHPMKHRLLDESYDEDIDATSKTAAGMKSVETSMPSLPTVLESAAPQCDWRFSKIGCVAPELPQEECQREGCAVMVHHLCQNEWHQSIDYEPPTIGRFCRIHDVKYASSCQLPLSVHGEWVDVDMHHSDDNSDDESNPGNVGVFSFGTAGEVADNCKDGSEDDNTNNSDDGNDDGDSADDGFEAEIHDNGAEFDEEDAPIDDLYGVDFVTTFIPGSPLGWTPPGPPENFVYVPVRGAPTDDELDNPGDWNLFSFAPRFNNNTKNKKYVGHFSPCGAQVVPANSDGVRQVGNWKFHYKGWTPDEFDKGTYVRGDATHGNLKPASRKGRLDANVLRKHGMSSTRMQDDDALFFYQMLFPIGNPKNSGVDGDNRMPYFSYAAICTNIYAGGSAASSGIGHRWEFIEPPEMVHWTACPIRNGALDGKPATLSARWSSGDRRYDPCMANSISFHRWKMIKRFFKLNNNVQQMAKGTPNYDPCVKYDFVYKVLVHNMNYVTERADLDVTADESTWGFGGYSGECGGRLKNKPVSRGKL